MERRRQTADGGPPDRPLPSITVVVPSLNQGRFLRANLDSIFRQGYPRLEVVVMDGGSTDDSVDIIRSFAPRLTYWHSGPDGGQAAAVNEGVRRGRGELVAWLNSDDFYWGDSLWAVARAYSAYPGYGLYVGNGLRYSQEQGAYTPFNRRHLALNRKALEEGLDYLLQPAVFFSRAAWEEAGGLDPALHYCMDWDLLIRIGRKHPAVLINEYLAVSREHPQTKTRSGRLGRAHEILGMIRRHTSRELTPGGVYYFLEALLAEIEGPALGPVRHRLHEAMQDIRAFWRGLLGSADGFPEKGDPQDRVYLPFVGPGPSPAPPASPVGSMDAAFRASHGHDPARADLPSVSVVVPSFNQARFLPQALDSLIGQDYPRLETFVVDGGSTDGTVEVLRRYEGRLGGWVSEPDRGPAHAINKGLARTRGEVVAWLASDDALAEGAVWEAARLFAEDPDLDLVYGNALYVDENNGLFLADHGQYRTGLYYGAVQPPERIFAYWSYVHAVPQPTVFFRRRLLETCGGLDESYQFIFDFELFYRFARAAKVRKLERTQAFYRIHSASKTSSWENFLVELYRFSRPLWPARRGPEFRPVLRDFVTNYLARRHPGPGGLRRRLAGARVMLSAWTGRGNPEAFGRARAPRALPALTPPPAESAPARPASHARPIDRTGVTFRSYFCSFLWPTHPGLCGGEIRDFHLLRHLLSLSRVTFYSLLPVRADGRQDPLAPYVEGVHTPETIRAFRPHLTDPHALRRPLARRLLDRLRRAGWPVVGPRYHLDGTEKVPALHALLLPALRADLEMDEPDFLFVGPQVNPTALMLPHVGPRTRLVLASYDVEAVRMARLGAARRGLPARLAGSLEARRARRFERDNLARFDGVLAVSELDKEVFVREYGFPPRRVLVVPNGVDTDYFAFAERRPGKKVVVFTASLSYEPNHQAALRLVDRVMPLVRRRHPEAVAWVVGQQPPADLLARHDGTRVVVTGKVEDVRPYLAAASVSCVPLLAGSGTKYKVLEALSAGVPVVCSPLGAEGLDLADGEHLLVGGSDSDLADAVSRVLSDPDLSARLARQGRARVERLYGWDVSLSGLGPWLAELSALPRRCDGPGSPPAVVPPAGACPGEERVSRAAA